LAANASVRSLARDACRSDDRDIPKPPYTLTRAPCFLRGTRIRTTAGYRRIEDLAPGERLPSTFGGDQPIRRVRRTVLERAPSARPWLEHAQPIRIASSALADNVPAAALVLTAAHDRTPAGGRGHPRVVPHRARGP
jgi:hypothetical protein